MGKVTMFEKDGRVFNKWQEGSKVISERRVYDGEYFFDKSGNPLRALDSNWKAYC